jgi:hypothetical protein
MDTSIRIAFLEDWEMFLWADHILIDVYSSGILSPESEMAYQYCFEQLL